MPGPLVGVVMIAGGVLLMALALWVAQRRIPQFADWMPLSFPTMLWRVAIVIIAVFVLISVYMRLFPEG